MMITSYSSNLMTKMMIWFNPSGEDTSWLIEEQQERNRKITQIVARFRRELNRTNGFGRYKEDRLRACKRQFWNEINDTYDPESPTIWIGNKMSIKIGCAFVALIAIIENAVYNILYIGHAMMHPRADCTHYFGKKGESSLFTAIWAGSTIFYTYPCKSRNMISTESFARHYFSSYDRWIYPREYKVYNDNWAREHFFNTFSEAANIPEPDKNPFLREYYRLRSLS